MDDIKSCLLQMHVPYNALVRGYMLRCCTMGPDKQLKSKKNNGKKIPANFHKEYGLHLH